MPPMLQLLGHPRFRQAETWIEIPVKQVLLVAAYLAYREEWVSRHELIYLFWPDEDEKVARHNLSQLLYEGKQKAWFAGLEAERNRVRWRISTDVQRFRHAVGEGVWAEATRFYRGHLLEGLSFEVTANFGEWLQSERETLQSSWCDAVLKYAQQLTQDGRVNEASEHLLKVLRQDPLAENVLQAYMHAAALAGQRDQALKAYDTFVEQLEAELAMEPLEPTHALAEKIRTNQVTPQLGAEDDLTERASPGGARLRNVPVQLTPLIGRDLELAELSGLLQDAGARLITVIGPGGVGKTRLVLELARQHAGTFRDGAVFVPLETLSEPSLMVTAIVGALGLQSAPAQDPEAYLLRALAAKELLIVLDNVEHLLAGIGTVLALLEACPHIRVLVTSREPLGFQGETLYDLNGLAYPTTDQDDPEAFDAVALFLSSAHRSHPALTLTARDHRAITHLCQRLEGLPLGIELAAAWTRLLTPAELAEEIDRSLDLLSAELHNVPTRHRSLRAVFESSWKLLSAEEQGALKRLSVFRGGLTRDAAQGVSGASLRTLLSLVNKCLLLRTQSGRFERHVTVYRFAQEKLAADQAEYRRLRQRHAEYFLALAAAAESELRGPEQVAWLKKLAADHDNLRAALSYALEAKQAEMGLRFGALLWEFWYTRGDYAEGFAYLTALLELPETHAFPLHRAKALNSAGILAHGLGKLELSHSYFEQNLTIVRDAGDQKTLSDALNNLGNVAQQQGDYPQAYRYHEESLALRRELEDGWGVAVSLSNLGNVAHAQGDFAKARAYFEESLASRQGAGDKMQFAYTLTGLGNVAFEEGNYREARAHYEQVLAHRREADFRWGISDALTRLGKVALEQRDLDAARACHQESLTIKLESGDRWGVAESLEGFAALAALEHKSHDALRFAGAAAAIRESVSTPLPQADQKRLDGYLNVARQQLGGDAARAFAEGHGMELDQAVALARRVFVASPANPTPSQE